MNDKVPECCSRYAGAVFVFGSNEAGRHGKGAALHAAKHHGAVRHVSEGFMGWEDGGGSYAIPTKDRKLRPLALDAIRFNVERFLAAARTDPVDVFYVTRIGCGYAGYKDADIAPMFANAPDNCILPEGWRT